MYLQLLIVNLVLKYLTLTPSKFHNLIVLSWPALTISNSSTSLMRLKLLIEKTCVLKFGNNVLLSVIL